MPSAAGELNQPAVRWRWASVVAVVAALLAAVWMVPPGTLPYPPGSPFSDAAIAHWPNAAFLRNSVLAHHVLPLWNPLKLLGQPFAANPLSKVWYPPQWLVLILPPTIHLDVLIYLHMAWLALGVIAWARAEHLDPLAGLFGAVALALNAKLAAHLGAGHLDIVYALAWTPWLMVAARRLAEAEREALAGAAARAGVVAALLALADVRIAFYMLPVAAAYGIVAAAAGKRAGAGRIAAGGGLALAIFGGLVAVQAVPLLALSPMLTRSAITAREASVFSLPPGYLLGTFIADAGGFQEWMTYLGVPVIALAGWAFARRARRAEAILWLAVAVVAALWALGANGPLWGLAARLPLVSWFRVPARAWLAVDLSTAALAMLGLDALLGRRMGHAGRLASLGTLAGGIVWLIVVWVAIPDAPLSLIGFGAALAATGAGLFTLGGGLRVLPLRLTRATAGGGLLIATLAASLLLLELRRWPRDAHPTPPI